MRERPCDPDLASEMSLLADARRVGGACWSGAAIAGDERGVSKAHLIARGLAARRTHAGCFAPGAAYRPLLAHGPAADHVVAHTMAAADGPSGRDMAQLVVIAVRLATTLNRARRPDDDVWSRTSVDLPDGVWRDVLVDLPAGVGIDAHSGRADLAALVGDRPAALLVKVATS